VFAAVIVLHASRPELARLLPTLPSDTELVVVDTGRDDGGAALARAHGATVLERRENPGFGAATNAGLDRVTRPVTVLLNPDTEDRDGVLPELAARAHATGLHAPRLLDDDGNIERSAHALPGTLGAFLPALSPWAPARALPHRARTPRTVGWAVAACLAARTELIRFDERIHLWAEDMDLCLRARARGVPTILHPDLALRHTGRHSIAAEPFEQLARNRRAVLERRLGAGARRRDDAAQLLTFAVRAFKGPRERAQLGALLKVTRPGRTGPRGSG
jgi:N-acetylglucosaminyl-diphospho-decaprenol L-rhamnosyltransferase